MIVKKLYYSLFFVVFIFLFPFKNYAQAYDTESLMYKRIKYGKTLKKALKKDANEVKYVCLSNYNDSVFPNQEVMKLSHLNHIVVRCRHRQKKQDSLLFPIKLHIDTALLKQFKDLKYLEFEAFDFSRFPMELCSFKQLKGLAIGCCLLDSLPNEIEKLSNLEMLQLRINNLKKIPNGLVNMQSLEVLDLGNNLFTAFPNKLLKLYKLRILDFSNIESSVAMTGSKEWPYPINVNEINYSPQLKQVLSPDYFEYLYLSAQKCTDKQDFIEKINDESLSNKIVWRHSGCK